MSVVNSGISIQGIQTVLTAPTAGRLYTLFLPEHPILLLRRDGYFYSARVNPSFDGVTQLGGVSIWTRGTGLTVPGTTPATYRLQVAWRTGGMPWELADFL